MGLLSIGASLLGGILGRKSQKSAARREAENREKELELQREIAQAQIDAQKVDLGELVAEAQAAGFNPSTVLNATGGQGFGSSQISATDLDIGSTYGGPSIASMALTGIGDYFQQNEDRELRRAEIDLIRAQTRQLNSQTQSSPILSAFTTNPKPVHNMSTDTVNYGDTFWANFQGPFKPEESTFPVRDPTTNAIIYIRPSHAMRLDLQPGATLMVEDYEAIQGDIAGEIQGVTGFIPEWFRQRGTSYIPGSSFFGLAVPDVTQVPSQRQLDSRARRPNVKGRFTTTAPVLQ